MPVTVHHNKRKDAHDFLQSQRVGVLATVSPDGDPYAAAIYFTVDPSFDVLFLTKTQTKKADNLEHNKHAMLVVYDPATQTTVQLTGLVSKIDGILETNQVFTDIINASIDTSGESVPGSRWSSALSSLMDSGSCSHRVSMTRYCGWVRPSGSRTGSSRSRSADRAGPACCTGRPAGSSRAPGGWPAG